MTASTLCQAPGCREPIVLAVVSNNEGKPPSRMPLNPEPDPAGNVACYHDETGRLRGRVLVSGQEPSPHETRYMPHFATCTDPEGHRRRRQRGRWTSAQSGHAQQRRRRRGGPKEPPMLPGMARKYPGGRPGS